MDVKKVLLVTVLVFLAGLTCQPLIADWPCPCYNITCDHSTLHFRFCLEDGHQYTVYYSPPDIEDWQHVILASKAEVHDCPSGCSYLGADIPNWDCSEVPIWYSKNELGTTVINSTSGSPCQ